MTIKSTLEYPYFAVSSVYAQDDNITFNPRLQQYADGHVFSKDTLFESINDLSVNRYTGLFVTDKSEISSKIYDVPKITYESFSNSRIYLFNKAFGKYLHATNNSQIFADSASRDFINFFTFVENIDGSAYFLVDDKYYIAIGDDYPHYLTVQSPVPSRYTFFWKKYQDDYVFYIETPEDGGGVKRKYLKVAAETGEVGFFGNSINDPYVRFGFDSDDVTYTWSRSRWVE